jgi:hypothetical protein
MHHDGIPRKRDSIFTESDSQAANSTNQISEHEREAGRVEGWMNGNQVFLGC